MCLGVVKLLVQLCFNVTPSRNNDIPTSKFEKMKIQDLFETMQHLRVPSEFQRRPRLLNVSDWKAEEFR